MSKKIIRYLPVNSETGDILLWRNGTTGVERDTVPLADISLEDINSSKLFSRAGIKEELRRLQSIVQKPKAFKLTMLLEETTLVG